MAQPKATLAERMRAHREAFELSLKLGCTPKEAEQEIARRNARANWHASKARLDAKIHGRPAPPPNPNPRASHGGSATELPHRKRKEIRS